MQRWWFFLFIFPLVAGCAQSSSVEIRNTRFKVEIADEPKEQALGLMFRTQLPEDQGMIFIFEDEQPRSFWMKNCKISLDILYFNSALELVGRHDRVPPCRAEPCPSYPSGKRAKYVLELNGGTAKSLGVELGDKLDLSL